MVDNEMALTFSVRNNPGVYALLLGSGVSTEAEIPTGWGVVEDLIQKLATAKGEDPDPDPFEWYEDEYDEEPEYDDLLEQVAQSKEERRSLLEKYFEPTPEDREQERKIPTEAHESIAWLVDEGYINVIITTNFDRLLEQALSERGVTPVVISSAEDAKGAEPLAHQEAVILKVNGDYKQTNIKNTTGELEEYDTNIRTLVEQIFDEYGLVVCGWSGKWDTALKNALLECKNRRYSTFWAYHGDLEDSAEKLVNHRDGTPIQIEGAGDFFSELKENVHALEGAESGAPLTREVARERVKRYMTREPRKIDLADLLRSETETVRNEIFDEERFPLNVETSDDKINSRLDTYENVVGTLAVATSTCAYWGPEVINSATRPLVESIRRLGTTPRPNNGFNEIWKYLRRYPATFLLYGIGVASVESDNWNLLRQILIEIQVEPRRKSAQSTVKALHPWMVGGYLQKDSRYLRRRIKNGLRDPLRDFLPDDNQYENSFHKFEAIMDLLLVRFYEDKDYNKVNNLGVLYWDTLDEFRSEIDSNTKQWGPIQARLFDDAVTAKALVDKLESEVIF